MLLNSFFSIPDIRVQLNEQLKCLDGRLETQQNIVSEIQDVFRRRAEIESNYSKELNKLANHIASRNKEQKQKREAWHLHSSHQILEQVLAQTRRASRDHGAVADIYSSHVIQRCTQINEDLQRIFKKVILFIFVQTVAHTTIIVSPPITQCREIGYEIHEEVLKVLHELHTAMKTHQNYQAEFRQAENKLQVK